ncbi:MAG TPA: hypothetical protein VGV57_03175 [Thermoleophilaceae bacterium]|nr:hypothetical protein [Thermoleophilaceae bacterium]
MTIDPVGRGQSESPVGNTVHNLVHTLSVKLDSAHRYGLYQEDAVREGHEDCAEVFADIAEQERDMIDRLVHCLQDRLGGASTEVGAAPGGGVTGGGLGYETIPEAGVQEVPPVPEDTELGLSPDALEAAAEPDVPPTAPGDPGAEPNVPPTAPGGPGTEPDVPPTAPGGPGAEPRGPDAPRTP